MNLNASQNPVKNEMLVVLNLDFSAKATTISVGGSSILNSSSLGFAEVICGSRIMLVVLLM